MNRTPDYEYLDKKVLSYSSLKSFADSPIDFVHYCHDERKQTAAMAYGSLVDCLVFTPDDFKNKFFLMPKLDGRKPAEKAEKEKLIKENQGKIFIDAEDHAEAKELSKFIREHEIMQPYLKEVELQKEFFFTDKKTGLKMRGFMDIRHPEFIADLKIVADASPKGFARQAIDLGYDLQAAVYRKAEKLLNFNFPKFVFIAVEKTLPYKISVNVPTDDFLAYGDQRLEMLLDEYKHALTNKLFHEGYEFRTVSGEHFLELPGWLKYKLAE